MARQGHERAADRAVVAVGHDAHGVARVAGAASCGRPAGPPSPTSRRRPGPAAARSGTAAGSGRCGPSAGSSSSPASIMCRPSADRLGPDRAVAGVAQPEGVGRVGHDQVERALGGRVEGAQRFAARVASAWSSASSTSSPRLRLPGSGPSVPRRLSTAATTPSSLSPSQVPPPSRSRPPRTCGRSGQCRAGGRAGAAAQLVAVGREQQRPGGVGPAQEDEGAHRAGPWMRARAAWRSAGRGPI